MTLAIAVVWGLELFTAETFSIKRLSCSIYNDEGGVNEPLI